MKAVFKGAAIAAAVSVLVACGGGGDDNPLAKYAGTFYVCDDDHTKQVVTISAQGSDGLNVSVVEQTYANANCTGNVVGTYTRPLPLSVTFEYSTTANFPPVNVLPDSAEVDRATLRSPAMTAQLTGSGVSGSCVVYEGGSVCYDSLSLPAQTSTGALYMTGDYLVTLELVNGTLVADDIYSKNPSFSYSMLSID